MTARCWFRDEVPPVDPRPVGDLLPQLVDWLVEEIETYAASQEAEAARLARLEGATPLPKGREVFPFMDIVLEKRREIAEAVLSDEKPPRFLSLGVAMIHSRAWYEWHWHRGIDPDKKSKSKVGDTLRRQVIERDGFVCGLCGGGVEPWDVHIDHIWPRSRGGKDELENLQVAHSRCNMRKGAKV